MTKKKEISPETISPRDGYDNTGTQGKDSLSDDAFTGNVIKPQNDQDEDQSDDQQKDEDQQPQKGS